MHVIASSPTPRHLLCFSRQTGEWIYEGVGRRKLCIGCKDEAQKIGEIETLPLYSAGDALSRKCDQPRSSGINPLNRAEAYRIEWEKVKR